MQALWEFWIINHGDDAQTERPRLRFGCVGFRVLSKLVHLGVEHELAAAEPKAVEICRICVVEQHTGEQIVWVYSWRPNEQSALDVRPTKALRQLDDRQPLRNAAHRIAKVDDSAFFAFKVVCRKIGRDIDVCCEIQEVGSEAIVLSQRFSLDIRMHQAQR